MKLNVKFRAALAAAVVTLLATSPARPTNDMRGLGVLVLSQMCAAQDAQYREGVFGQLLQRQPSFSWEAFDSRPLSRCLHERQWVPESLCKSVTALDPGEPQQLDAFFHDNADTLHALEPVLDFFNDVAGQRTPATECPKIALQKEPAPRPPEMTIERAELIWAGVYEGEVALVPRVNLVKSTDEIDAAVGVHFGIYFRIVSKDPAEGILTVLTKMSVPEPGLADGAPAPRRVLLDRPQCLLGKPCVVGFVFEREEEILPGKWVFEVSARGKTLIEHTFTVRRTERTASR